MGVIAEKFADDKGLVWPDTVAPYQYHLIGIGEKGIAEAGKFYDGREDSVLYDDRDKRPGEKFADAELMGIPLRIVISDRTLEENMAEITDRKTGKSWTVTLDELFEKF
jgi:prolyl-tRNA synthetase